MTKTKANHFHLMTMGIRVEMSIDTSDEDAELIHEGAFVWLLEQLENVRDALRSNYPDLIVEVEGD
jgi:hypothetical protein